jgi:hypothetical protein
MDVSALRACTYTDIFPMSFCLNPGITHFLAAAPHARGFSAVRLHYHARPQKSVKPHRPWIRTVKAFLRIKKSNGHAAGLDVLFSNIAAQAREIGPLESVFSNNQKTPRGS